MLLSLTLTNFQKHRTFNHAFQAGLTLVTGENWRGKTSIIRGLLYALFGSTASQVRAANLVTRGEKTMEVQLVFRSGDLEYEVTRGPNKAELRRNNEVVASGQTPVTAMIESLIGDAKSFLTFQTARQGEASGLLTLGATKLAQHIDTVTGVDTVDQVLERAKEARDALAAVPGLVENAEREQGEFTAKLETVDQELLTLTTALDLAREQLNHCFLQTDQTRHAWEHASQRLAAYQAYVRELGEITRRRDEAEAALRLARRDLDQFPEQNVEALYQRLVSVQDVAQSHALQAHAYQQWQAQYEALERGVAALLPQTASVPLPELEAASEQSQSLSRAWMQAIEERDQAQRSLTAATCHACGRPFADHDLQAAQDRLSAAQLHVEQIHPVAEEARNAAQSLRAKHAAQDSLQQQIVALQTQQRALVRPPEPGLCEAGSHLADLQRQYQKSVKVQAARAQALKELQAAEATQRQASAWLASVVAVPEGHQEQVDQALAAYHAAYQAHQQADQSYRAGVHQRERLESERSQAQFGLDRATGMLAGLQQQAQRSERLTQLMKYLRDSRERFTTHAWANLLAYASTFVQEASGGALTELRRTTGGEFTYVEDGEELPLELASGQQLAILGVAAKLALAAAVGSSFEVLLLDEVSAAASDDNALQLATCLARTGQQILLVSHRDADAAVAADVIAL